MTDLQSIGLSLLFILNIIATLLIIDERMVDKALHGAVRKLGITTIGLFYLLILALDILCFTGYMVTKLLG